MSLTTLLLILMIFSCVCGAVQGFVQNEFPWAFIVALCLAVAAFIESRSNNE